MYGKDKSVQLVHLEENQVKDPPSIGLCNARFFSFFSASMGREPACMSWDDVHMVYTGRSASSWSNRLDSFFQPQGCKCAKDQCGRWPHHLTRIDHVGFGMM